MALIVEDGSGLEDADAYISVADADQYHANMGNDAWSDLDAAAKEASIRKATLYIDGRWGNRFPGTILTDTQALCWPRSGHEWPDVIPLPVQRACAELALRSGTEELMPDLDRGGQIAEQGVGGLYVKYAAGAPASKAYPWVDRLMARVVTPGNGVLVRT